MRETFQAMVMEMFVLLDYELLMPASSLCFIVRAIVRATDLYKTDLLKFHHPNHVLFDVQKA